MEAVVLLLSLLVIFGAAGLSFWAMWRTTSLNQRLHPLTPEQRRRKRKAYAAMIPFAVVAVVLGALIGTGGTGAVVALGIVAAIMLIDVLLTPWLHYRHARRRRADHRG